jgi:hypothetical protein
VAASAPDRFTLIGLAFATVAVAIFVVEADRERRRLPEAPPV